MRECQGSNPYSQVFHCACPGWHLYTPESRRAPRAQNTKGVFAVGDVHGDIKLITVAWAEGIQAAIYAFKEITSPYWLNEKRLRDQKITLIGEKITQAAQMKPRSRD